MVARQEKVSRAKLILWTQEYRINKLNYKAASCVMNVGPGTNEDMVPS